MTVATMGVNSFRVSINLLVFQDSALFGEWEESGVLASGVCWRTQDVGPESRLRT